MENKIRIFHLEDYQIMRDGIRFLLQKDASFHIVGEAGSVSEFTELATLTPIDILLLDLFLEPTDASPAMDGFEICKYVKENHPEIRIIAHSMYSDADRIAKIMNQGAMGFVSKKSGYEELISAIKTVYQGRKYISKDISTKLKNVNQFLNGMDEVLKAEREVFSPREREVLELLATGYSTKNIARTLFITEKTVETHRKNMVDKAHAKNTAELIAFASTRGLIKH